MYTWTESNEAPCLPHRFRLWVQGRASDSGQESWELDTPLEGVDLSLLGDVRQERHQRYRAPAPRDLEIVETLYSLVVSWAPAPCVQAYFLSYRKVQSNTWQTERVEASDRQGS